MRYAMTILLAALVALATTGAAEAQKRRGRTTSAPSGDGEATPQKPKVFDFTGLDVSGRLRAPQLLYFLDRANEELQRASLERRSFIPEMVRSLDEGGL
jgi:hypothetical protein